MSLNKVGAWVRPVIKVGSAILGHIAVFSCTFTAGSGLKTSSLLLTTYLRESVLFNGLLI